MQGIGCGCSLLFVTDNKEMIMFTWSCRIFTYRNCAVLPAGATVCGVAPGPPLIVGVTAVVVIQSSGKGNI